MCNRPAPHTAYNDLMFHSLAWRASSLAAAGVTAVRRPGPYGNRGNEEGRVRRKRERAIFRGRNALYPPHPGKAASSTQKAAAICAGAPEGFLKRGPGPFGPGPLFYQRGCCAVPRPSSRGHTLSASMPRAPPAYLPNRQLPPPPAVSSAAAAPLPGSPAGGGPGEDCLFHCAFFVSSGGHTVPTSWSTPEVKAR